LQNDFSPSRHLFYWMVEESPAGWTDEALGTHLQNLIKKMRSHLTKEKLPHYMIYKQNTLDGVPKHKMRMAHERFHRMYENLVPHIMVTIRRLQYNAKHFYPMPDMLHLYNVLTTTNTLLLINPSLMHASGGGASDR
jgi:hypothetical protein